MLKLWHRIVAFFRPAPMQTCWCWCPGCRRELTAMAEAFIYNDGDLVHYACDTCGMFSTWDFSPPVPILLDTADPCKVGIPNCPIT